MKIKRILLFGASLTCLTGAGLTTFSDEARAALPTAAPTVLLSTAIANAESSGWVHEQFKSASKGHTFSADNEIGTLDGEQVIRYDDSRAEVLLVDNVAYIKANAKGVANYFELTTTDPQALAGKWLSVTSSNPAFATYVDSVTLTSDFSQLELLGPYTVGAPSNLNHQRVLPVHGLVPGPSKGQKTAATLYVTANGKTLPVEFVVSSKAGHETETWSAWGRQVHLTAPTESEPIPKQ